MGAVDGAIGTGVMSVRDAGSSTRHLPLIPYQNNSVYASTPAGVDHGGHVASNNVNVPQTTQQDIQDGTLH